LLVDSRIKVKIELKTNKQLSEIRNTGEDLRPENCHQQQQQSKTGTQYLSIATKNSI